MTLTPAILPRNGPSLIGSPTPIPTLIQVPRLTPACRRFSPKRRLRREFRWIGMLVGSTVFMALVGTAARNIPRLAAGTNPDPAQLSALEASSLLADPTVVVLSIEPPLDSPVKPAGFLLPDDTAEDPFHARP